MEGVCPYERHTLLSFLALYMCFCDSAWTCRYGLDFNLLQHFPLELLCPVELEEEGWNQNRDVLDHFECG